MSVGSGPKQMQMLVTRFERLSRRISLAGLMSGHRAVEAITAGRVQVDGKVVSTNFKVFSEATVIVDGREAPPPRPRPRLWAMAKPRRVLCQAGEKEDVETLGSLMRKRYEREVLLNGSVLSEGLRSETLFDKHYVIVCGLPFTADGLVLLTNDGLFAEALTNVESKILTAYDVKIKGDPPVDLLHSWRRNARAGGFDFGQVFCSIIKRTGTTTKLRIRLVESSQRPLDLLLEKAKMRVMALHRYSFGPYLSTQFKDDRCVEVDIHKSLMHLCPKADMRQALVPSRGGIVDGEGLIRSVSLHDSAVVSSDEADATSSYHSTP